MNKKVLIVEDEFVVANDLRLILLQAGYKVIGIAASAEEAVECLPRQKPDIVILDIRLEGKLTGIDLARKLKADDIAFIFLSANSNQKVLEEAKTTEPYGFLVKPFREKDLLVMLDIAWYRHTHSLESKLRQEEQLQKQLAEINNASADSRQKLLRIAETIQSFIPFDLVTTGIRPFRPGQFSDIGYLRIGFDEYQFIGQQELMTITGIQKSGLSAIIENSGKHIKAGIYNSGNMFEGQSADSLTGVLFKRFGLETYLLYPINLSNGLSAHYFFYSRNAGIYTKDHIALLGRIKMYLLELAGQTIHDGSSSTYPRDATLSASKKELVEASRSGFKSIIGNHPLLLAALDLTTQVAPYNTSVLILGESGTGKENIAKSIHSLSPRKNGPFVKINCAAIPANLIESELFGHEKGAFTGAFEKRKGKFEQADGGTIFLDEIGELPLEMQVKLLRVLQEKEIEYVGGSSTVKVNVRIVAATNRNLEKEIGKGTFRLDLYYRLNVFPITLPPLRKRKSDIEALTLFFANKFCQEFNKTFNSIAASMTAEMYVYDWPGNIRELENVLEQTVILNDGKSPLELKRSLTTTSTELFDKINVGIPESVKHILKETEKEYIISSLKKSKGLIRGANGAAELLNIKPTTLESKMAKLGIKREDFMY